MQQVQQHLVEWVVPKRLPQQKSKSGLSNAKLYLSKDDSISDARGREQEDGGKVETSARIDGSRKIEKVTIATWQQWLNVEIEQSEIQSC